MHDDPFARAVERAQAAEHAEAAAKRDKRQRQVSSGARTAFRTHASVFVAVNLLLVVIWATTTAGYPWFLYPLLGWGIGLVAHYAATENVMRRRSSHATPHHATAFPPAPAAAPAPAAPAPTPAPPMAPAGASVAEDLARLAELHNAGQLTDEEFSFAKARLLK